MDKIWDGNPSKSEVIGRCDGDEKNEWPRITDAKSRMLKKTTQKQQNTSVLHMTVLHHSRAGRFLVMLFWLFIIVHVMLHFCIEQLGKVQRKEQNLKIWYCVAFKVPENAKKGTALLSSQCVQLEI